MQQVASNRKKEVNRCRRSMTTCLNLLLCLQRKGKSGGNHVEIFSFVDTISRREKKGKEFSVCAFLFTVNER